MNRYETNIGLLIAVAEAIGEYRSQFVFVGGAIAGLLVTSQTLLNIRPTDDIDIIVETTTYGKYTDLVESLRELGFKHDMNGPLCRFTINGIKVDIMPTEGSVLGFNNKWYPLAIKTATKYLLPNSLAIRLINAPLFICTKLEAFADRGKRDFLTSHDIEDVIAIINGRPELVCECWGMPIEIRKYLIGSFQKLKQDENFLNALPGLVPYGSQNRETILLFIIDQLARLPLVPSFSGQIMVYHTEDPPYLNVISMNGTNQMLARRDFPKKDELINCLTELGILTNQAELSSSSFNRLYTLNNIPMHILSKWALLSPLD